MGFSLKKLFSNINEQQSGRAMVYVFSQVVLQAITVVTLPLFTRMLTTEQYGRVAVYSTWNSILALFIGLRVDTVVSIAKVRYGKDFEKFCANAYFIVLVTGIGALFLVYIFLDKIAMLLQMSPAIILFLILHSFGMVCTQVQSCIFLITKKSVKDIILSIFLSFTGCLLSVLFILNNQVDAGDGRILGMGLPYIVIGCIYCAKYIRRIGCWFDEEILWATVRISVPMIFHGLSNLILAQSDRMMISKIVGDGQTGIYSFCYTVATPLTAIWLALGRAWKPDYYDKLNEQDKGWIKEHSNNYLFLFTSLTCGYLLVAEEMLKFLGTKEYWTGIQVLPFITVSCYFQFLYSFSVNYEMFCNKTKMISIASVISATVNVVLNLLLIPIYEMLGAALATLLAYMVLFLIHDFAAHRIKGFHYNWNFYLKGLFPVVVCFGVTYVFSDYVWIRWGLGIGVGVILIRRILRKRTLL